MKKRTLEELRNHFWSKIKIGSKDECWPWLGTHFEEGYGMFHVDRIPVSASREAFKYINGEPENFVLHKCDNRSCCNPNHLYDGTQKQNMEDRKRRCIYHTRLTGHKRAKLTGEAFAKFQSRISAGEKPFSIAKDFGIHGATACKIAKQLFSK